MNRRVSGAIVGICVLLSATTGRAQSTTEVYIPPNGSNFSTPDTIYAAGTLAPSANNVSLMFQIDDPIRGMAPDPNFGGLTFASQDMFAAMGFPGQYIVWYGTLSPTNAGWTQSPIIWQNFGGFQFPSVDPDHYVTLRRNLAGGFFIDKSTGPHSVN